MASTKALGRFLTPASSSSLCRAFKNNHNKFIRTTPVASFSTSAVNKSVIRGKRLIYKQNGDPNEVVEFEDYGVSMSNLGKNDIMVRMLAAPINPADINMIQGVYPIKPDMPAVGGNEGVGEVMIVGEDVNDFSPLDRVVPANSGAGTWQSLITGSQNDFVKVTSELPVEYTSMISVNPCTAYRMLNDFADLSEGDTVIQNGSNSGVGTCVIQIAKAMGLKTINIVRSRDDDQTMADELKKLGADVVLTEDEVNGKRGSAILNGLAKPKLALNSVGGRSSLNLAKVLAQDATMVTYGGMSKKPVMIPTGKLIFNDVQYKGFWMTRWNQQCSMEERVAMLEDLTTMMMQGQLILPFETFIFSDAKKAIAAAQAPFKQAKPVILFS